MIRCSTVLVMLLLFFGSEVCGGEPEVLKQDNLVAWCIVPFDAAKRTPEERAEMLQKLGLRRCAYDWRAEHVPTFEAEIQAYRKHGIEFFAFWRYHPEAFRLFEKYDLHPQIWEMIPRTDRENDEQKVEQAAQQLKEIAQRTQKQNLPLGLYNHGGWEGEPKNLVAVCKRLRAMGFDHVGIVYNFHHGHDHIADWPEAFAMLKPYLLCLNVNGMNDNAEPKILGIGRGVHEQEMIQVVIEAGYDGPIGILDHRNHLDAKDSLQENLDGLTAIRTKATAGAN